MPGADPPLYLKILLAAALLVVIAVARLPFIGNVLAGEEGDFAALVLDDVPTSVVSDTHLPRDQIGFIDGKPVLTSFHRTIMPYIILERLGRAFAVRHALGRLPAEQLTVAARLPFAIIFLLGSAGLIALTVRAASSTSQRSALAAAIAPLGVTLWSLTTPLAVGASIEPQVDGSVGVLLLGTAASLLVTGDIEHRMARWRFLVAGLLAGLGKHEWALAFAAATLGAFLVTLLFSSATTPDRIGVRGLLHRFGRGGRFVLRGFARGLPQWLRRHGEILLANRRPPLGARTAATAIHNAGRGAYCCRRTVSDGASTQAAAHRSRAAAGVYGRRRDYDRLHRERLARRLLSALFHAAADRFGDRLRSRCGCASRTALLLRSAGLLWPVP